MSHHLSLLCSRVENRYQPRDTIWLLGIHVLCIAYDKAERCGQTWILYIIISASLLNVYVHLISIHSWTFPYRIAYSYCCHMWYGSARRRSNGRISSSISIFLTDASWANHTMMFCQNWTVQAIQIRLHLSDHLKCFYLTTSWSITDGAMVNAEIWMIPSASMVQWRQQCQRYQLRLHIYKWLSDARHAWG